MSTPKRLYTVFKRLTAKDRSLGLFFRVFNSHIGFDIHIDFQGHLKFRCIFPNKAIFLTSEMKSKKLYLYQGDDKGLKYVKTVSHREKTVITLVWGFPLANHGLLGFDLQGLFQMEPMN